MGEENNEKQNEKQGKGKNLDAMSMTKADVKALTNKASDLSNKTLDGLATLLCGDGYSAAEDAVHAFADEILFGTLYDFHEKNQWLKNIGYEDIDKLANAESGQTPEDLMTAMEMWRVINGKGGEQLNNVYQYLEGMISSGFLRQVYVVLREDHIIRSGQYSDLYDMLDFAFEEFYKTLNRYKAPAIFNEIPVKKANAYEVNHKLVVDHMLAEFNKQSHIGCIIHDTISYVDAYWYNYFTILDCDTKRLTKLPEISKFADEIARIATLDNEVTAYFKSCGSLTASLGEVVHNVLDYIRSTLREARDILNNYRYNTQEFPYSLMHYTPYAKKVAESFMSLKDPVTNGTRYVDIAWGMVQKCEQVASSIAKQAP